MFFCFLNGVPSLDVKSVFCVFEHGLDSRVFVCICSTLDGKHTYLGPGREPRRGAGRSPARKILAICPRFASISHENDMLTTLVTSPAERRLVDRPLEHVELSTDGGYTLGASCRRLRNFYGGYITLRRLHDQFRTIYISRAQRDRT